MELITETDFDAVVSGPVPVLVEFTADWCLPCRHLVPVLDGIAEAAAGRLNVVGVDVDAEPGLRNRFGVLSVPRLLLFEDGRQVADIPAGGRRAVGAALAAAGIEVDPPVRPAAPAVPGRTLTFPTDGVYGEVVLYHSGQPDPYATLDATGRIPVPHGAGADLYLERCADLIPAILDDIADADVIETFSADGGLDDAVAAVLAGQKGLTFLACPGPLTDAGLALLSAGLPRLSTLSLSKCQVTDLTPLAGTGLDCLYLDDLPCDDAMLAQLDPQPNLLLLSIACAPQLTATGLGTLRRFPRLSHLTLHDAGPAVLAALPALAEHVPGLMKLGVTTDLPVPGMAAWPSVQVLRLNARALTDEHLARLDMPALQHLTIGSEQVTDAGLRTLARLTDLETLGLDCPRMTAATVEALAGLRELHVEACADPAAVRAAAVAAGIARFEVAGTE